MRRKWGEILRTCTVTAVAVALVSTTGAVAAATIDGGDIKKGTITSKQVKNLTLKDFKKKVRKKIKTPGEQGPAGEQGQPGEQGEQGEPGASTPGGPAIYSNPQWGVIARNTIGSPVAELRGGPYTGATEEPPFGIGSLGLVVNGQPRTDTTNAEAASFGNEVDFAGDLVNDIEELGFYVYTTGENNGKGNPNMPNIKFEIDPNLDSTSSGFSTLTYQPANTASNQWSDYIDATVAGEDFFLSGAAGTATGCTIATPCDLAGIQAALTDTGDEATIGSVAIAKGRDFSFAGAVDGLTINDDVYDFEPFGVEVNSVPAP